MKNWPTLFLALTSRESYGIFRGTCWGKPRIPVRGRTILAYYRHRLLGESYRFSPVNIRGKLRYPRMGKSPDTYIPRLDGTGKNWGEYCDVPGKPMFPRIQPAGCAGKTSISPYLAGGEYRGNLCFPVFSRHVASPYKVYHIR